MDGSPLEVTFRGGWRVNGLGWGGGGVLALPKECGSRQLSGKIEA